ncbi:2124_t:CDS:2 [Rhizophagus irregularis]|nr:2124_t:CDS:2 [Rhizophagus irregularis]
MDNARKWVFATRTIMEDAIYKFGLSLIQDGSRSQSCNYVLKPLSAHTNQLLFSLELTFPKPIFSPEWDFSPNSYMLLSNQSFNNLQEFQNHIDNNDNIQKNVAFTLFRLDKEDDIPYEKI